LRYFERLQPIALLVLRVVIGAIMIGHGYDKIFGGGMMAHYHRVQGLGLPGILAFPSAFAEFFGGILVLLGLFTRYAAAAILIDMLVAIWKVHWQNGLLGDHGYEFPLSISAICFTLICYGPGPLALEILRKRRRMGPAKIAHPGQDSSAKNEGPSPGPSL
jgi:putative oxidoreductase